MKRLIVLAFAWSIWVPVAAIAQPVEPEPEPAVSDDVCLKLTGNRAQARAAIRVLGLDRFMLREVPVPEGEPPEFELSTGGSGIHIDIVEHPKLAFAVRDDRGKILVPAVFADAPYLRIRPVSDDARANIRSQIIDRPALPAGLEKVDCPTTLVWAGG